MDSVQQRDQKTVGILGAGRVGTAVARLALDAGYRVKIATSKPASEISLIVDIVTPGAEAVNASDLADAEMIVVAVPLHKYRTVDPALLQGKTVIDVMNYWSGTDGEIAEFEDPTQSSSEVIAQHLAGANLVKSFNHIGYHDMEPEAGGAGDGEARALALAGDDPRAVQEVAEFISSVGFAPVIAGDLRSGRLFEPGTPIFNGRFTAAEMEEQFNAARVSR
ncbi:NADPH-dependent F420 reductase [Glutamicibacter sp. BSL13]